MAGNLFGNSNAEKEQTQFKEQVDTHSKALLAVTERQKGLESTLDILEEKIELTDHTQTQNFKKIFNEIKSLREDFRELKTEIKEIKSFNEKATKQIKLMSTRDEVQKLEKYIDLWNPMEFVTQDTLQASQKEIIDKLTKVIEEFLNE